MKDLGTLGGSESCARSINNYGAVAGYSETDGSTKVHAFVYMDGHMNDLGTLFGYRESRAFAINDDARIVGWSDHYVPGWRHAVIWEPVKE